MNTSNADMEAARQECGRLAFISNIELSKFLADPKEMTVIGKECFDADISFEIVNDKIHAVIDKRGEKLEFDSDVALQSGPKTLNDCVDAMRVAVRREIECAMKVEGGSMELFSSNCINQAVEVAEMIRNTRETEEASKNGLEGLKAYLDQLNAKLSMFSELLRKDISKAKRVLLNVLITLNVSHRNFVAENLIATCEVNGFPLGFEQDWRKSMRFYWDEGVKVQVDAYACQYGYEYIGIVDRLVVTPLTRQAYATYGRALFQGQGVISQGPAGTGKTETAKDFYRHLGRQVFIINSSDELNKNSMANLINGADQCGACLCFDEFNRVTIENLADSLSIFKKHSQKKQSGLALTMNPDYAGRTHIDQEWFETFSRLTMMYPDYGTIMQVMLHSEGMGLASDELYMPLKNTLFTCKAKIKQFQYDFGLRTAKATVRRAGVLVRNGVEAADAIYTSINATIYPRLSKEDVETYKEILNSYFPSAKNVVLDEDFEAKFASAHPDASDFTKEKAAQINATSQIRHGLMVLAEESKIIEDVVGVLGGSCSVIDTPEDMETFYKTTIIEEFAKAAASSCHWIVLKQTPKTHWAIFIENLNTVLDDNKAFINHIGERIEFPSSGRILILAYSCDTMSPATLSRCGVINMIL